jgi:hypothetical protein
MNQFEQNQYSAMIERAVVQEQDRTVVPFRRPSRMRYVLAPAMAIAACFLFFYASPPAQQTPSFNTQLQEISDTVTYEALDDWTDEVDA